MNFMRGIFNKKHKATSIILILKALNLVEIKHYRPVSLAVFYN